MKTHCNWTLALATGFLFAAAQAMAQAPMPMMAPAGYGPMPSGVQQVGYHGCAGCGGAGCNACVGTPVAGGFRLANMGGGGGACGGCGNDCGGACGGGQACGVGGLGGALSGLGAGLFGALQGSHSSRYGGFGTQQHGQQNGPFGGGGCCTPIWHDFHIEASHLRRDKIGDGTALTSRGISGETVLSTDDLELDDAFGFRATYTYLIKPSTNLELTYFGSHSWDGSASVRGASDLWSVFSNFGTFPPPPQQGFQQTVDAAVFHGIEYESELHNVELNCRRRWVSANCLLHGSTLFGIRHISLNEDFSHDTLVADGGFLNYDVETENKLTGVQLGGDMYVCVSPRFKFGAEIEAGLYGNSADYNGNVNTREVTTGANGITTDANPINENDDKSDVAIAAEAGLIGLYKITPRLTLRGGYTAMYIDGVALASENINVNSSPFSTVGRTVDIDNNGEVFYHGANLGITWMW